VLTEEAYRLDFARLLPNTPE